MRLTPIVATLAILSSSSAHAFDPDDERGERIAVEAGIGLGGTAVGIVVGGLVGLGIGEAADECDRMFGCLIHVAMGGAVGGFAGMVTGVYLGGYAMEANGGAGWTLLGGTGGLLLAGGVHALLEDDLGGLPAAIMWTLFPLTGCILGYELSTTATPDSRGAPLVFTLPPIPF